MIAYSGLGSVPSNNPWPASLKTIDLGYNSGILEVSPFAFHSATGLERLSMWAMGDINFRENALAITSEHWPKFEFYTYGTYVNIEDNAFGDVDGGELWGEIMAQLPDFPEGAFRIMLKSNLDLGQRGRWGL